MSSPADRAAGEGSPAARISEHGSPHTERRDSPLSERLDTLSGERRSLVRTEKRVKGQHSASVVVGSVRIKAEFDDFSYGDTCSVSPKVLAERKKYRTDENPELAPRVKEEPVETGVFFGDGEQSDAELHTPVASSAYQLSQLAGPESIGNYGMWSHKKFGIGGFVQYASSGTRSSSQSDSPGLPKSFYPRDTSGSTRGGASIDGSPDSGNSTESRKSFPYGSPKMVMKSEKSPSPKCDPATTKSTPVQSPLTPEQFHSQAWLSANRSKSCSPDERSPREIVPHCFTTRGEASSGLNSRHIQDFELTSIYPCKFCKEAFSLYTALQEHIRLEHCDDLGTSKSIEYSKSLGKAVPHHEARSGSSYSDGPDNKYNCKFCSLGFDYYTVLQEHIRVAHDGGRRNSVNSNASAKIPCSVSPVIMEGPSKYPCKHCEESFPLYTALQEHIRIEHGENAYWGRAAYMSMMTEGREEFLEELMNRSDCQFCPEKFASSLLLQEHIRVEHVPKWAAQKKALSQTLPPTTLTNDDPPAVMPLQSLPPEEPINPDVVKNLLKKYVCAICGKEYANKMRYQVHVKSHNKEPAEEKVEPKVEPPPLKPAEPPVQIPQFPANQDSKTVNVEDLRYVCEVCNARFPLYVVMQEHIRTAHGEKPFKCDLCEKEFIKRNYLMKHMKAHAEAKAQVLKCHKCDRCFMDQARLQEHAKEHTNEGRYKCHVCGSCFTHKMHHDQHVRTHSGEKPYKCGECGKQFTQPGPFHNHLRSHARCAYCNRTFLEKAALLLHLKAEHGQKGSDDANHASPVSVGSVAGSTVVPSSLMPVSVRLPDSDYIVPSPNEPLNLSKNSKESPLRVTPVTIPTGSHLMSPVMFPGMELYADLMSSLGAGAAMSVASSNSNNSLNDSTSRPNSAKSDTMSEIRLSKSDVHDARRSPSLVKERDVVKFLKENSKMPGHRAERTMDSARERDLNGSDKAHHGPLSVDFLSTSSGLSSFSSKSSEIKQAIVSKSSSFASNASLKCDGYELPAKKSQEPLDRYWPKSPGLESMFVKGLPPEHFMYSAMMHPELFQNSLSPLSSIVGPMSAGGKRRHSRDRSHADDIHGSPSVSKTMRFENQHDADVIVDSSGDENSMCATNGSENFVSGDGDEVEKDEYAKEKGAVHGGQSSNHERGSDDGASYFCGICTEILPTESCFDIHVCEGIGKGAMLNGQGESNAEQHSRSPSVGTLDSSPSQNITPMKTEIHCCKICAKIFWDKSLLTAHLKTHGEFANSNAINRKNRGQHLSCDFCDQSFTSSVDLIHHLRQHNGLQQHECPVCRRLFILQRHLLAHMLEHVKGRSRPSQEGGEKFSQRTYGEGVNQHGDRSHCNLCGASFLTVQQLQQHVKSHETDKGRSKDVDQNHTQFESERPRNVSSDRPFQCAKCHERFGAAEALVEHIENNLCKTLTCAVCQRAFLKKSQLKCHLKTHQRLGKGGKDGERGNGNQSSDAGCFLENYASENLSFTDNCDTFDNREHTPENATSMTANRLAYSLKGDVCVDKADGKFHAEGDGVNSE